MHQTPPAGRTDADFDPTRRFVRVTGSNAHGFVEFEFSIGSDELCVELMLPPEAFAEFCVAQRAERLPAERPVGGPAGTGNGHAGTVALRQTHSMTRSKTR